MNLDFNAITAGATVVAVFVAIYAIWVENRRSRFSQGVELLFRMTDIFFYSKEFIESRRKAAIFLRKNWNSQKNSGGAKKNESKILNSLELDVILNYFQGMAILVRKNAIDKDLTWNYLFWWFDCYYILSQDYIKYWRQSDPNYWNDIDWLHQQLAKIERKKNPQVNNEVLLNHLNTFIADETKLE